MLLFCIYRLITNLVSISAYSDNVFNDVLDFVEFINSETYYTPYILQSSKSTLIHKFALIIKHELPNLPDTLWLVLTVLSFSTYTVLTSGIVMTSILFSLMCLTMCIVVRWKNLVEFFIRIFDDGEQCV